MVTLMIQSELGLETFDAAEDVKRYPLAKVESVFNIRHEDGTVQFFSEPLPPHVYARVVVLKPEGMVPLSLNLPVETIRQVRIRAKERVFVTNALRALRQVSPTQNVRDIDFVVLVGGSALDFEIPQLVTKALADYRVVAGRANIRGTEGPRNAVATGLALSWGQRSARTPRPAFGCTHMPRSATSNSPKCCSVSRKRASQSRSNASMSSTHWSWRIRRPSRPGWESGSVSRWTTR